MINTNNYTCEFLTRNYINVNKIFITNSGEFSSLCIEKNDCEKKQLLILKIFNNKNSKREFDKEEWENKISNICNRFALRQKNVNSLSIFSISLKQQKIFFRFLQVKEKFPLYKDSFGKIKLHLNKNISNFNRIIYVFEKAYKNEEKQYLIGKCGNDLKTRCANYLTVFNKQPSAKDSQFLKDVRNLTEYFSVGILYVLHPNDSLNECEKNFIKYKKGYYKLYNENTGGGGGLCYSEEKPLQYIIPNNCTPSKYYTYKKNENGDIRPALTFQKKRKLDSDGNQFYAIKKITTNERYIGTTNFFERRAKEHAYASEYRDPENKKYDVTKKNNRLYQEMASSPNKFEIGLYPIKVKKIGEKLDEEELLNHTVFTSIQKVEKFLIEYKEAQKFGYNCNAGGGGGIGEIKVWKS